MFYYAIIPSPLHIKKNVLVSHSHYVIFQSVQSDILATIARNNARILSLGSIVDIAANVQKLNATVSKGAFKGKVQVKKYMKILKSNVHRGNRKTMQRFVV